MFDQLLGSVREAGAILRGQKAPSRRIVIGSSGVRAIRERTRLSQSEFAHLIGVSVKHGAVFTYSEDARRTVLY
jgi:putative transcriptional regulator